MATSPEILNAPQPGRSAALAPPIEGLLARLRRAVRMYVWTDGLATLAIVLGAAFWGTLAVDWLFELPIALRAIVLAGIGLGITWLGLRRIVQRLRVSLTDRSMALVLERQFSHFGESLLTTVELSDDPRHAAEFDADMLAATARKALAGTNDVRIARVFNRQPLARRVGLAVCLAASVLAFAAVAPAAFGIWARRTLLMSNELWPRRTHLVVAGFADGRTKLARGADLQLVVKADAARGRFVPETVEVRTFDGTRLREKMSREGVAVAGKDEFQNYSYTFKGVLAPIEFYVTGGDDRQGPLRIDVVDSPTINKMTLKCIYPEYMQRAPRELTVTGIMPLPRGARITVQAESNKDLVTVQIDDVGTDGAPVVHQITVPAAADGTRRKFDFTVPSLAADKVLLFTLSDIDGIRSREPVRLSLSAVPDEPPQVDVQLSGIGTAITPSARLPALGKVTDDYGVAKVDWWYQLNDGPPREQPLRIDSGRDKLAIDEALDVSLFDVKLQPKQKLQVAIQAADTYALGKEPNVASSPKYVLDVVTPEQLRGILEARELMLRRRLETMLDEMTETRDALVGINDDKTKPAEQPADKAAVPGDTDQTRARTPEEMALDRRLRVERVAQNAERTAHELLGLAAAFDDIRAELINNRVDTEELKSRLQAGIAIPLRRISEGMFPEFQQRVKLLEEKLADAAASQAAAAKAREQADAILVQMRLVLDEMLKLETFKELVDLLRGIINSQEKLIIDAKEWQKQKVRDLIKE